MVNNIKRIKDLKSNMDRFIVVQPVQRAVTLYYLKSNMDRFIDEHGHLKKNHLQHLKSNMDRFIGWGVPHWGAPCKI